MLVSTFDYTEIDDNDVESMEAAWNLWVRGLHAAGYYPGDEPLRWTDTSLTYRLHELALVGGEEKAVVA